MQALSEYRSTAEALPDLLNYGFQIENGLMLNKDGSLSQTWSFFGEDANSSTPEELELISGQITRALNHLNSGWMIHVDAIRTVCDKYPDEKPGVDAVSRIIDAERRIQFSGYSDFYESKYFITFTYKPPHILESKVTAYLLDVEGEDTEGYLNKELTDLSRHHIELFKNTCSEVVEIMKSVLNIQRLNKQDDKTFCDQLSHLKQCVTGRYQTLRNPGFGMPLDVLIGAHDFVGGLMPKIEDQYIQIVSIDGYAPESYPTILKALDEYPGEYRWSSRFIFMDQLQAELELKSYQRKWQQKIRGFLDQVFDRHTGRIDEDARDMADDSNTAISELKSGVVKYGFYTSVVLIYRDTREEAESEAKKIRNLITINGFNARIEASNSVAAWLGSLPGHGHPNITRPPLHTMNLADMLPSTSVWPGKSTNPCKFFPKETPPLMYGNTTGRTPFRINLHVEDTASTFLFGPPGSGKSTALAFLVTQWAARYADLEPQIFMFDKGASSYAITKAMGGSFYDIGADTQINFAPLTHLNSPSDITWATEYLEFLLELQDISINARGRSELFEQVSLLAQSEPEHRTITDLCATIQNKEVLAGLSQYSLDGPYGMMLDAKEDSISEDMLNVFEISHLMETSDKILLPVMMYLFRRIEKRLATNRPTLIIIDEAWLPLSNDIFAAKIDEWLRVVRKLNAAVVMASQKVGDMLASKISSSIIESCVNKIFLPNPNISNDEVKAQYKSLGLNDKQMNIIRAAIPKREYYYTSPYGRRLYSLALAKVALAFVGASQKDNKRIKALIEKHGENWVYEWLAEKELDDWALYWQRIHDED